MVFSSSVRFPFQLQFLRRILFSSVYKKLLSLQPSAEASINRNESWAAKGIEWKNENNVLLL